MKMGRSVPRPFESTYSIIRNFMLNLMLSETITYIGPFYEYDRKKKEFKKPILTVTREILPKKKK